MARHHCSKEEGLTSHMKKIICIIIVIMVIFFVPAFLIPFSDDRVSSFFYRELVYSNIARDIEANNERDKVINLFSYVSNNLSQSATYNVVDINPYTDAIRGIGWCDQQAFLLMNLLHKVGINRTRLRDVQQHTYSEVFIEDKWVIVDPFFGFIPLDINKKFLGVSNLSAKINSDYFGVLKSTNGYLINENNGVIKSYKEVYIPNDVRWINGIGPEFKEYRSYNLLRSSLDLYSSLIFKILGKKYFNWVQNIYLKNDSFQNMIDPGSKWILNYFGTAPYNYVTNDKSFSQFNKARNYDLANRSANAKKAYKNLIDDFPYTYWTLEGKFSLAVLKYKLKNYNGAETLFLDLITGPEMRRDLVNYYLGMISIYNNNNLKAISYFSQSSYYLSKVELSKLQ